jgi:hypothetical protein
MNTLDRIRNWIEQTRPELRRIANPPSGRPSDHQSPPPKTAGAAASSPRGGGAAPDAVLIPEGPPTGIGRIP